MRNGPYHRNLPHWQDIFILEKLGKTARGMHDPGLCIPSGQVQRPLSQNGFYIFKGMLKQNKQKQRRLCHKDL